MRPGLAFRTTKNFIEKHTKKSTVLTPSEIIFLAFGLVICLSMVLLRGVEPRSGN